MTQTVLRLCDANGKVSITLLHIRLNLLLSQLAELNLFRTIKFLSNLFNPILHRIPFNLVQKLEIPLWERTGTNDSLGEFDSASTTFRKMFCRNGVLSSCSDGFLPDNRNFSISICGKSIDGYDNGNAKTHRVFKMFFHIDTTLSQKIHVLGAIHFVKLGARTDFWSTTMYLKSAHCCHDDDTVRYKTRGSTFDVEEAFAT